MQEKINFCAIICEFNPFHNGHKHLINTAKKMTGLPVLCLMSGNFCQRATPTILEKKTRAQHAIEAGADVVFQLPTVFSIGSAETFAKGAIHILSKLPVSHIIFGSECGDINLLNQLKNSLIELEKTNIISQNIKNGENYKSIIISCLEKRNKSLSNLLKKPNNVLAVEYLKALEQTKIIPLTIKREDNHLLAIATKNYASSTAIRESIKNNELNSMLQHIPSNVLEDLKQAKNTNNIKEHLFFSAKLTTKEQLKNCPSVSEGLENRIFNAIQKSNSYDELIEQTKTKRYTRTRIKRILLENFFKINKSDQTDFLNNIPITQLLARKPDLHFDGFFEKEITLILKKSDYIKHSNNSILKIDNIADILYQR